MRLSGLSTSSESRSRGDTEMMVRPCGHESTALSEMSIRFATQGNQVSRSKGFMWVCKPGLT